MVLSARRPPFEPVTSSLLDLLRQAAGREPDHLPAQLALIETLADHLVSIPQFCCYDSAFHDSMPRVARQLPLPRRFDSAGIQRYGFHGLSCAYLMAELERIAGRDAADGRIILAHLGGGASVTAVHHRRSMDTSMGFTPAGGLIMATRAGDLDPGLTLALMQSDNLTPGGFDQLVNHDSGLLGVSGMTGDMRQLLERQSSHNGAAEAVELFCYQLGKWFGALGAVLGGVDTIVFSGGIGENAAEIRERACARLGFLGVAIDPARNATNAPIISTASSPTTVRVIPTDEEIMIARAVGLALQSASRTPPDDV